MCTCLVIFSNSYSCPFSNLLLNMFVLCDSVVQLYHGYNNCDLSYFIEKQQENVDGKRKSTLNAWKTEYLY